MDDTVSRQAVKDWLLRWEGYIDKDTIARMQCRVIDIPSAQPEVLAHGEGELSAQPTLRERALMLLLNWAVECDFGYDNFPEEYERYKDEIEDMSYFDGMIYIAEKEVERNETD